MRELFEKISPRWEFAIVIGVAFGYLVFGSLAQFLHPGTAPDHNGGSLIGLVIYEAAILALLLPFLWLRGWTPMKLGLKVTLTDSAVGVALFFATYLVWTAVWIGIAFSVPQTASAIASKQVVMHGIPVAAVIGVGLVNPFFEELFVTGYVITALRRGPDDYLLAVNASVGLRLLYHLYQGPLGVVSIIPLGLIFGYWFAKTGKLWPVIVAHTILDLIGLLPFIH